MADPQGAAAYEPSNLHRERAGSWDRWPWRQGRKVGRTIYAMAYIEPSDDDVLIGMMDTEWYAEIVCRDHNAALEAS